MRWGVSTVITVLVIEDNPAVLAALEGALGRQPGFDCVGAVQTIEAASVAAATESPDVVVVDSNVPRVHGPESTLRLLRSQPQARLHILARDSPQPSDAASEDAGEAGSTTRTAIIRHLFVALRKLG
jgi:DNA-binding NarL/FixJ family response regulator